MNAHLLLLLAYSVALGALGLAIGRRVRTTGQFFVSGRALGPGLLCATVLAANIGLVVGRIRGNRHPAAGVLDRAADLAGRA